MQDLLPVWLELLAVVAFGAVALSHLRHLLQTDGQRRPWHACHVLMAASMAFMYAPGAAQLDGAGVCWQIAVAGAGVLAVLWALWGASGTVNPVWLLTALDLGAMMYMWSPAPPSRAASALVMLYLIGDAGLWTFNAHRGFNRAPSLLRWLPLGDPVGGAGGTPLTLPAAVPAGLARADTLLGERDIGPSMVLMSLGMAYMAATMWLLT